MKKSLLMICALMLLLAPALPAAAEGAAPAALGTLEAVQGDVQLGEGESWRAAAAGDRLHEGQTVRTGPDSGASIAFDENLVAKVGAETEIEISDLLLKTRLEKMKSKITEPGDVQKVEMQVTPTTGVRGTEQTEEKAEDLKREHYWNENVKSQ